MDTVGAVTLYKLPVPPTGNHQLQPVKMGGYLRLIKSKQARAYEKLVMRWGIANKKDLPTIRDVSTSWVNSGLRLRVDLCFHFPRSSLYTKKNEVKKMDVNNRIKSMVDVVSEMIAVDDRHFFSHFVEKVETPEDEAYCTATVTPYASK